MKMRRIGLTYEFWDPDQGWKMTVSHVKEHGDGIGAYVIVEAIPGPTDKPGSPRVIEHGNLNLMSTMTRGRWGKDMDARFPITGHWNDVIGKISLHVIQQLGQGEPVVDLHGDAVFKPVHYLIEPILLKDEPNIIFAEGSAGKSYLSLLLGLMVQLPWAKNPWRFRTPKEPTNVLFLDWEGSQPRTESRLAALVLGMGLNNGSSTVPIIKYRRCSRPLDADVFEVMKWVRDYNIGFIIIDSLMPAQSGDVMDPSAPRTFYMALRELNTSSLIIAHLSKEDMRKSAKNKAKVYGCYASDTEVLTKAGWKLHKDVALEDWVAAVDYSVTPKWPWKPACLRWEHPSAKWEYDYAGSMIHIWNTRTDALVSDGHSIFVRNKLRGSAHEVIRMAAEDFKAIENREEIEYPIAAPLKPYTSRNSRRNTFKLKYRYHPVRMDPWLKFLGYWLSEGSVHEISNNVTLHQSKGPVLEKMKSVLDVLDWPYSDHIAKSKKRPKNWKEQHILRIKTDAATSAYSCRLRRLKKNRKAAAHNHFLADWLREHCGSDTYDKHIPDFVWDLRRSQMKILLGTLLEGDGSPYPNGMKAYWTVSEQLASDVQRLATLIGYPSMMTYRMRKDVPQYQVFIDPRSGKDYVPLDSYDVYGLPTRLRAETVDYKGKICCLSVPTGAYVTRRNGKVALQGNSVFNENLSRQIWELKKTETVGRRGSKLALHHRKANYTELQKPIGFQVEFDGPRTVYRPLKVSEDDTLSQDMDLEDRLEELLITLQEGMPGVMAESLEVPVDKIVECLKAHPNKFVPLQNGFWGLLAREGDQ